MDLKWKIRFISSYLKDVELSKHGDAKNPLYERDDLASRNLQVSLHQHRCAYIQGNSSGSLPFEKAPVYLH